MKNLYVLFAALCMMFLPAFSSAQGIYDYTVKSIDGNDYPLAQLKGKKMMIVNVASKCGHTKQYKQLQALYEKYKDKNFVILGFPANNFRGQEPGTNAEILEFCRLNYGVSFPMMEKISVKGDDIAPIYKWLTLKSLNGHMDSNVKWNFQKYLINPDGTLYKVISPSVSPDTSEIISWIEEKPAK